MASRKKAKKAAAAEKAATLSGIIKIRQRRAILTGARVGFVRKLVIIAAVAAAVFLFVFGVAQVRGEDMAPALRDGDIVIYFRLGREYNQSDVLVYRHDGQQYIGRVGAAPGAALDKTEQGLLLIDGRIHPPQPKNGLFYDTEAGDSLQYPMTVADGTFFILGDRRDGAQDSRMFGPIDKKDVKGKVFSIIRKRGV